MRNKPFVIFKRKDFGSSIIFLVHIEKKLHFGFKSNYDE